MTMRATHKRTAREAFVYADLDSDDTYAMSEDISEDESMSYQDQAERISSPKSTMEMPMMLNSHTKKSHHTDFSHDEMAEKRVTIWNWREQRKLSGNSPPFKKNLQEYLRKHPDWEEYVGQDKDENGKKSFAPKKRRKDFKPSHSEAKTEVVRRSVPPHRAAGMAPRAEPVEVVETASRRRAADATTRQRAAAEAEAAWLHAKEASEKQKEQEEKEACRWREFSAIQHIIDHYNQGPAKSPFVGDNAMMNA